MSLTRLYEYIKKFLIRFLLPPEHTTISLKLNKCMITIDKEVERDFSHHPRCALSTVDKTHYE